MANSIADSDRELLARAAELQRPLRRAAAVAHANGLGLVIFGALTLCVSVLDPDVPGLLLGAVVLWAGLAERRAALRLLAAERRAPRDLARNELVLLAAIAVYAVARLTVLRPSAEEWQSTLEAVMTTEEAAELWDSAVDAGFGMVLVVALAYQGSLARYFWRRQADLERFLNAVPEWAREVLRGL